jgi:hypothetical protein
VSCGYKLPARSDLLTSACLRASRNASLILPIPPTPMSHRITFAPFCSSRNTFRHSSSTSSRPTKILVRTLFELMNCSCVYARNLKQTSKQFSRANAYTESSDKWNITRYSKINKSHFLSDYEVKMPYWSGGNRFRRPFAAWSNVPRGPLAWYRTYNTSKHDRAQEHKSATFNDLIDAFFGLSVVLTAQFLDHDFGPMNGALTAEGTGDGCEEGIGQYVRLRYPANLPPGEQYDFDWETLSKTSDPFQKFNYDAVN